MNSIAKKAGIPQIRCRALSGGTDTPFCYEVKVQGRWVTSNHSFAEWVVSHAAVLSRSGVSA